MVANASVQKTSIDASHTVDNTDRVDSPKTLREEAMDLSAASVYTVLNMTYPIALLINQVIDELLQFPAQSLQSLGWTNYALKSSLYTLISESTQKASRKNLLPWSKEQRDLIKALDSDMAWKAFEHSVRRSCSDCGMQNNLATLLIEAVEVTLALQHRESAKEADNGNAELSIASWASQLSNLDLSPQGPWGISLGPSPSKPSSSAAGNSSSSTHPGHLEQLPAHENQRLFKSPAKSSSLKPDESMASMDSTVNLVDSCRQLTEASAVEEGKLTHDGKLPQQTSHTNGWPAQPVQVASTPTASIEPEGQHGAATQRRWVSGSVERQDVPAPRYDMADTRNALLQVRSAIGPASRKYDMADTRNALLEVRSALAADPPAEPSALAPEARQVVDERVRLASTEADVVEGSLSFSPFASQDDSSALQLQELRSMDHVRSEASAPSSRTLSAPSSAVATAFPNTVPWTSASEEPLPSMSSMQQTQDVLLQTLRGAEDLGTSLYAEMRIRLTSANSEDLEVTKGDVSPSRADIARLNTEVAPQHHSVDKLSRTIPVNVELLNVEAERLTPVQGSPRQLSPISQRRSSEAGLTPVGCWPLPEMLDASARPTPLADTVDTNGEATPERTRTTDHSPGRSPSEPALPRAMIRNRSQERAVSNRVADRNAQLIQEAKDAKVRRPQRTTEQVRSVPGSQTSPRVQVRKPSAPTAQTQQTADARRARTPTKTSGTSVKPDVRRARTPTGASVMRAKAEAGRPRTAREPSAIAPVQEVVDVSNLSGRQDQSMSSFSAPDERISASWDVVANHLEAEGDSRLSTLTEPPPTNAKPGVSGSRPSGLQDLEEEIERLRMVSHPGTAPQSKNSSSAKNVSTLKAEPRSLSGGPKSRAGLRRSDASIQGVPSYRRPLSSRSPAMQEANKERATSIPATGQSARRRTAGLRTSGPASGGRPKAE